MKIIRKTVKVNVVERLDNSTKNILTVRFILIEYIMFALVSLVERPMDRHKMRNIISKWCNIT